jgi:hypothetical protein
MPWKDGRRQGIGLFRGKYTGYALLVYLLSSDQGWSPLNFSSCIQYVRGGHLVHQQKQPPLVAGKGKEKQNGNKNDG